MDIVKKMKLYNGEDVADAKDKDVVELKKEPYERAWMVLVLAM
jgi:predicted Ser/Thr protein kinase